MIRGKMRAIINPSRLFILLSKMALFVVLMPPFIINCGNSKEDASLPELIGYLTGINSESGKPPSALYSIAGSFSIPSTARNGLVLRNNSGDDLASGTAPFFIFPKKLPDGAAYRVTVLTNPSGFTCAVTNGAGQIQGADVTDIVVGCSSTQAPGGAGASCSMDADCMAPLKCTVVGGRGMCQ